MLTSPRMDNLAKYRGQWGGKIESGEEMWWTEPHARLFQKNPIKRALSRIRYHSDVRQFYLMHYLKRLLKQRTNTSAPPVVLDFGCGTGGVTLNLSQCLGIPITGYDIFPTQVEMANQMAAHWKSSCQFKVMDAEGKFPLKENSVDVIVSGDVLGHVPHIPETLREWARVLKIGGGVSLFTEASYSENDHSLMAKLAKDGMDMCAAVPEHISLFPKETLEKMFSEAGFAMVERKSANLLHWFFYPKDYVLLFQRSGHRSFLYYMSFVWNKILKITPFYPVPVELFRLFLTQCFGGKAYGTGYFYLLKKVS